VIGIVTNYGRIEYSVNILIILDVVEYLFPYRLS
jgi:hypothetical protein